LRESGKATLARAAMIALEPVVEVLLELGVTSPEAESLLRSLFIHKAREWLARRGEDGASPSDVRVALVTGVHRNFVRHILAEPPRIAAAREQRGHSSARLLEAWHADRKYLDSSGKPRDLPERGRESSFSTLATTYLPGTAPGVVLDELERAGLVQRLAERRVRVRSRAIRPYGFNVGSVGEMGNRGKEFLETLHHNLRQPASPLFCDGTAILDIDTSLLPVVRNLINSRATTFLIAMQNELAIEVNKSRRRKARARAKIGLTVFETEQTRVVGNRRKSCQK
jgi:hypothetical protein